MLKQNGSSMNGKSEIEKLRTAVEEMPLHNLISFIRNFNNELPPNVTDKKRFELLSKKLIQEIIPVSAIIDLLRAGKRRETLNLNVLWLGISFRNDFELHMSEMWQTIESEQT